MLKKKKKKEINSLDDIEVKLKKIGNIRPGVYLTVLYAFIFLLVLFLVFFLPGIRNPGAKVTFASLPESAAVYVDGEYVGTTPCTAYLRKGDHSVRIGKRGYKENLTKALSIDGRIFASLIFPKKQDHSVLLEPVSLQHVLGRVFTDFSAWSGIDAFHYRYQPDTVLSKAVEGITRSGQLTDEALFEEFFTAVLPYVSDEALLKDFIRGFILTKTKGKVLTPDTLLETLTSCVSVQNEYKTLPMWLARQLSSEHSAAITDSSWYNSVRTDYNNRWETLPVPSFNLEDTQRIMVENVDFVFIPPAAYPLGSSTPGSFPIRYASRPFYISDSEISYRQFSRFLAEREEYRPSNIENLVQDGLVTEEYLQDWEKNKDTDLPVAYVSYFVAEEYCKWLAAKLPAFAREDFTIRLPTEYQWEAAALLSNQQEYVLHAETVTGPRPVNRLENIVLKDFYGNLWEWCDNWYAKADFVLFRDDGTKAVSSNSFSGVEKSVRGGSWAVMEDLVSISSRGGQPPHWCTPFLGFRPAIVEK